MSLPLSHTSSFAPTPTIPTFLPQKPVFLRQKSDKQKEGKMIPHSFGQPWQKWELMHRAQSAKRGVLPWDQKDQGRRCCC